MSGEYVIAKADASPILTFPSGIALITISAGRRYLAADAGVRQHPQLFAPVQPKATDGA